MNAVDTTIEALVVRGAIDMARFIQGRACGGVIHWLDENEREEDLHRPGHSRRVIIAISFVLGLISLRATGVAGIFTTLRGWLPAWSPLVRYVCGVGLVVLSTLGSRYQLLL